MIFMMTKWLSYQDILQLKQVEEMVEVYYNSNQFVSTMKYLVSLFTTPFEAYWSLAQYYDEKGYFIKQPSRMYRYEVLLEFAETIPRANLELIKELLTFDLYLRWKIESTPALEKRTDEAKEVGRIIFLQLEEKWALLSHYKGYNVEELTEILHSEAFDYTVWRKEMTVRR